MRNPRAAWMPALIVQGGPAAVVVALSTLTTTGCEAPAGRQQLDAGYQSLAARQYDQAVGQADTVLQSDPSGPTSAEALYLRGRAFEQRVTDPSVKVQPDEAHRALAAARNAYVEALKAGPSPELDAYVRTSLANVAYFQDDYGTALEQWSVAYDRVQHPDTRAWTLYRIGLCQQRLGRFDHADATFAAVQQQYPGTLPAQRAKEHQGQRGFYVQLATFKNPASADRATNALKQEGVTPVRVSDPQGRQLIRVGPVQTYQQAQSVRARYAGSYPDALIVP